MLEKVKFNKKPMKKAEYKEQWDELLAKLVVLQQQAHNEGVGLVVLFEGWNGAGKGSRISDLMYHLDARSTGVYVGLDLDPDTEREFVGRECGVTGFYPIMRPSGRPWASATPSRSTIAAGTRRSPAHALQRAGQAAASQERGAPLLGLRPRLRAAACVRWLRGGEVLRAYDQESAGRALAAAARRPGDRWRVTEKKLESHHGYETAYELYDRLLERSDYDFCPLGAA